MSLKTRRASLTNVFCGADIAHLPTPKFALGPLGSRPEGSRTNYERERERERERGGERERDEGYCPCSLLFRSTAHSNAAYPRPTIVSAIVDRGIFIYIYLFYLAYQ